MRSGLDDAFMGPTALSDMAHWEPVSGGSSLHLHGADPDPYLDGSGYHTPIIKRPQSPFSFSEIADYQYQPRCGSSRSETEATESIALSDVSAGTAELGDEDGQNNKLKGTVWPGMALFDSATPEQKRKRNQRKDNSVLEQMIITSQAVTATECIWSPEWGLQRARDIYASPSIEGSPEVTPTRKRKSRPRRQTPTKSDAALSAKGEEPDIPKKKRTRRAVLADVTNVRLTRAAAKNADAARSAEGRKKAAAQLPTCLAWKKSRSPWTTRMAMTSSEIHPSSTQVSPPG